jgi:hypothetical protein
MRVAAEVARRLPANVLGPLLRDCLDRAIDGGRTGRFVVDDVQQSAKTAIGTDVEIAVRNAMGVPKGAVLDLLVDGIETDVKWSTGSKGSPGQAWMIPDEALGRIVLLVTAYDTPGASYFAAGLLRVPADGSGLSAPNKDNKRGLKAATREQSVLWLHKQTPMPANFVLSLPEDVRQAVLAASGGSARIETAVRLVRPGTVLTTQDILTMDVPDPVARMHHLARQFASGATSVKQTAEGRWQIGV